MYPLPPAPPMPEVATSLRGDEVRLRELFVSHYMMDFDAFLAALRMGYDEAPAKALSLQMMLDPYVLNRLEVEKGKLGICTEQDEHRRRIIGGLYREANNQRISGSARVAAWAQLAKLQGLEPAEKSVVEQHVHTSELTFRIVDSKEPPEVLEAPSAD